MTDHALGLAWLTLSAERHDPQYVSFLASARSQSTAQEQQQARVLATKMHERYSDAYAVARAERRYRHEMWAIRDQVSDVIRVNSLHPIDPWSSGNVVQIDGLGAVQPMLALRNLQVAGNTYFQGWGGHVTVEPLVPVDKFPASPASVQSAPSSHR